MKVYIYYEDTDNSCCGSDPAVKVFSSIEKALAFGIKKADLKELEVDCNELIHIDW